MVSSRRPSTALFLLVLATPCCFRNDWHSTWAPRCTGPSFMARARSYLTKHCVCYALCLLDSRQTQVNTTAMGEGRKCRRNARGSFQTCHELLRRDVANQDENLKEHSVLSALKSLAPERSPLAPLRLRETHCPPLVSTLRAITPRDAGHCQVPDEAD